MAEGSIGTVFVDMVLNSDKYTEGLKTVEGQSTVAGQKMGQSIGSGVNPVMEIMGAKLRSIAALAASAFATHKIYEYAKEATMLTARLETMTIVLGIIGKNAGYSSGEMKDFVEQVKKMGITTDAAQNSLTKMAQANLDLNKAAGLARVAQDAAVIGNTNSSAAFERIVYGIKTAQTEVLRTIGINVSFEASYAKFAASLNKSTGALSENEKMEARLNAVMIEGIKIQGAYEAAMATTGKLINSLPRYFEEVKEKIGELFSPALGVAVRALMEGLDALGKTLNELSKSGDLAVWAENFKSFFTIIKDGVKDSIGAVSSLGGWFAKNWRESKEQVYGVEKAIYGVDEAMIRFNAKLAHMKFKPVDPDINKQFLKELKEAEVIAGAFSEKDKKNLMTRVKGWYEGADAVKEYKKKLEEINKTNKPEDKAEGDQLRYQVVQINRAQQLAEAEAKAGEVQKAKLKTDQDRQAWEQAATKRTSQANAAALEKMKIDDDKYFAVRKFNFDRDVEISRISGESEVSIAAKIEAEKYNIAYEGYLRDIKISEVSAAQKQALDKNGFVSFVFLKSEEEKANLKMTKAQLAAGEEFLKGGIQFDAKYLQSKSSYYDTLNIYSKEATYFRERLIEEESKKLDDALFDDTQKKAWADKKKLDSTIDTKNKMWSAVKSLYDSIPGMEAASFNVQSKMAWATKDEKVKALQAYYKAAKIEGDAGKVVDQSIAKEIEKAWTALSIAGLNSLSSVYSALPGMETQALQAKVDAIRLGEEALADTFTTVTDLDERKRLAAVSTEDKIRQAISDSEAAKLAIKKSAYSDLKGFSDKEYSTSIEQNAAIRAESERTANGNVDLIAAAKAKEQQENDKAYIKMAGKSDSFFVGVTAGFKQLGLDATTWGDVGIAAAGAFAAGASKQVSENFINLVKGDWGKLGIDLGDIWDGPGGVLQTIAKKIGDMAVETTISTAWTLVKDAWFGSGADSLTKGWSMALSVMFDDLKTWAGILYDWIKNSALMKSITTGLTEFLGSFAGGLWEVPATEQGGVPAIVHAGEMILPKAVAGEVRDYLTSGATGTLTAGGKFIAGAGTAIGAVIGSKIGSWAAEKFGIDPRIGSFGGGIAGGYAGTKAGAALAAYLGMTTPLAGASSAFGAAYGIGTGISAGTTGLIPGTFTVAPGLAPGATAGATTGVAPGAVGTAGTGTVGGAVAGIGYAAAVIAAYEIMANLTGNLGMFSPYVGFTDEQRRAIALAKSPSQWAEENTLFALSAMPNTITMEDMIAGVKNAWMQGFTSYWGVRGTAMPGNEPELARQAWKESDWVTIYGYPAKHGIDYVPYDNFKINAHKGERVLTAEQNQDYSEKQPIHIHLEMNGREIAYAVADEADRNPRLKRRFAVA